MLVTPSLLYPIPVFASYVGQLADGGGDAALRKRVVCAACSSYLGDVYAADIERGGGVE